MKSIENTETIRVEVGPSMHSDKPHILASATVTLTTEHGVMVLNDFRYFIGRDGQVYFAAPTVRTLDANGSPQWVPVIELSPELERRVYEEAQKVCESL